MLGQEGESVDSIDVVEVSVDERAVSDRVESGVATNSVAKGLPDVVADLRASFKEMSGVGEKIEGCLDLMGKCLVQQHKPSFRGFWEARKLLFELFADPSLAPGDRTHYQGICKDLSREALFLKDRVKEVSNFAAQQIELAIQAMKVELGQAVEVPADWDSGVLPECLEADSRFYFESH
ncbi:hypothetical protein [Candidatus Similichlamydia laticola]|nr:hypothetical protein [Candidatus Similichlamydia laticola]RDB31656.1 Serine phosphatase RsbU, regulator of sigma subunit [Candidatus Similichlamydia laticola]